jgi:hypothetical protein
VRLTFFFRKFWVFVSFFWQTPPQTLNQTPCVFWALIFYCFLDS